MSAITAILARSAKAVVAAVTPIVTAALLDVFTEVGALATTGIASAATAATVWLTRNRAS